MSSPGEETLRGIQGALLTFLLPELQSEYARSELMLAYAMLGMAADEWDGAVQTLVDDNAALRVLLATASESLTEAGDADLARELRAFAADQDSSLRIGDLAAANARLRDAVGRLAVVIEASDVAVLRGLRSDVIEYLRREAEGRARSLLGPRPAEP
jgi:hypothetical protein